MKGLRSVIGVLAGAFSPDPSKPGKRRVQRCRLVFKILQRALSGVSTVPYSPCRFTLGRETILYPEARMLDECRTPSNFRAICHVILHEDAELRKAAIRFVDEHLLCPELDFPGLIDLLVASLDGPAGKEAFGLLCKIQQIYKEYNAGLDTSKMIGADKEIMAANERVRCSVFLRFLPVPFVRIIVKDQADKTYDIFCAEKHRQPEVIWNKEMRALLLGEIRGHVGEKYLKAIREFAAQKTRSLDSLPRYVEPYGKIVDYPQLSGEMRSGEFYLSNSPREEKGTAENVNQSLLVESLEHTLGEIIASAEKTDFAKLDMVLGSFKLALRGYDFAC